MSVKSSRSNGVEHESFINMDSDRTRRIRKTVLSKVVCGFLPISGDFTGVKNSCLKVLLPAALLLHYTMLASMVVTSFSRPLSASRFPEFVDRTHGILMIAIQVSHFTWMRNRRLLRQITEEITLLMSGPLQVNSRNSDRVGLSYTNTEKSVRGYPLKLW